MFKLPWIKWFLAGNIYTGSVRQDSPLECFQYRVKKEKTDDGDLLRAWVWYGRFCFASTPEEDITVRDFTPDEQGREDTMVWLDEMLTKIG